MKKSRIKIMKTEEKRVNGRPVYQDVVFYECWCEILDLVGAELYQAISIKLENTLVFKIRYCKLLEELRDKKNFSIQWKDSKYSIYDVDFMGYNKKHIKIKCKRVG